MNKIVVGLGNPGHKYGNTKHNAGFIAVDEIARSEGANWNEEKKFKSLIAQSEDFLLVKPQTGMNLSGEAVSKVTSFYKIGSGELFVIHDDVDFPLFTYKIQFGKESAGHKGVEDIIKKLGTKDFWRIRIGIGRPQSAAYDVVDYVLSRSSPEELEKLRKITLEIFSKIKQS